MTEAKSKIYIASDHAGFALKSFLIKKIPTLIDLGTDSTDSVDYPDIANKLCEELTDYADCGILICGSGVGISIAANRFKHIRAALCSNKEIAELSRKHNNANVLCLGSRFINEDDALSIITAFLATKFEGGRHDARVQKLSK
jgi:ribose 5-phosphate isomerase B